MAMVSVPSRPALAALERRDAFQRDGWLFVPRLVGKRTVASLAAGAEELVRLGAHLDRDGTVGPARYFAQSASGRAGEPAIAPGMFRKITFGGTLSPAFTRLVRDPRIAAAVAAMGVERGKCVVDQLNLKAPRIGTGFPWHQDARFLPWKQQEVVARHGGVNVVIAIDRADTSNGGFEVLTGTHLGGPKEFDYDTSGTNEGVFDERGRTLVPMEPGDAVLFHPYLAHGSGPNLSDAPRRLATLWFIDGRPL